MVDKKPSKSKKVGVKKKRASTKKKPSTSVNPAAQTKRKKTNQKKKVAPKKQRSIFSWLRLIFINKVSFILLVFLFIYVAYLDVVIRQKFDGKKWALPARVFARPLELYQGYEITYEQFIRELKSANYKLGYSPKIPGTYSKIKNGFRIKTREFSFSDENSKSIPIEVIFAKDSIARISHAITGKNIDLIRLDPALIASIYPAHNEDRELIKITAVPTKLKGGLIAVEDRNFYSHYGVAPFSILRALWANIRAGKVVQGGSTLTQQLIKNFHLTSSKTIWRKANEAIMALLLDAHYSKDEILEAYINEVYLGQDGNRAIHGFALASNYYFNKSLDQLSDAEMALLIGMVRGASYYDPIRHPKRANKLKNLVLKVMLEQGVISKQGYNRSTNYIVKTTGRADKKRKYPAFIDLVRRQLINDYDEDDLRTEGLRIFTTLEPYLQHEAEQSLKQQINRYKKRKNLDGAVVITSTDSAEVLAIVGGKNTQYSGFNRAIDAKRQIGSLVKPMVYYTALNQPERYTLVSKINDEKIDLIDEKSQSWSPRNYDKKYRGEVTLLDSLVNSYNASTVRLGVDLGIDNVIDNIELTGIDAKIKPYPSALLGAVQLSPMDVAQMYQVFAANGYRIPLRAIREVLDKDNQPLTRYGLSLKPVLNPQTVFILNAALQEVVESGTAKLLSKQFDSTNCGQSCKIAGKTGTTNDLRDSWFAGFSADKLGVVWMGADGNQPIGLTGSTGAMQVWSGVMQNAHIHTLNNLPPDGIEQHWVDKESGFLADKHCKGVIPLPFDKDHLPQLSVNCEIDGFSGALNKAIDWIKN